MKKPSTDWVDEFYPEDTTTTLHINIDKDAIRFNLENSSVNLFWKDLFLGVKSGKSFQDQVMENLFEMYNILIKTSEDLGGE